MRKWLMEKWSKYLEYKRDYAIKYRRVLIIFKLFYAYLVGVFLFLTSSYVLDNYISLINFIEKVYEDAIINPSFIYTASIYSTILFFIFVFFRTSSKEANNKFRLAGIFLTIGMYSYTMGTTTNFFDPKNDYYGWIEQYILLASVILFIAWTICQYISYLSNVSKGIDVYGIKKNKDKVSKNGN